MKGYRLALEYNGAEYVTPTRRELHDTRIMNAKAPCGVSIENIVSNSRWNRWRTPKYVSIHKAMKIHIYKCAICQIKLTGGINSTVLGSRAQVVNAFILGFDDKESSSVRSSEGTLWHYSTKEAIRMPDGTVVQNSQCNYRSGWGYHCPYVKAKFALPLSTLKDLVYDLHNDLILYSKYYDRDGQYHNAVVFQIRGRDKKIHHMFYSGHYHRFLDELPYECKTAREGFAALEPPEVKAARAAKRNVQRQGEFWFIHIPKSLVSSITNIKHASRSYLHYNNQLYGNQWTMSYSPEQFLDTSQHHRATYVGEIEYNHVARLLGLPERDGSIKVCSGRVVHTSKHTDTLKFGETWHAVFQNMAMERHL